MPRAKCLLGMKSGALVLYGYSPPLFLCIPRVRALRLADINNPCKRFSLISTHTSGVQGTLSPDGERGVPAQSLSSKQAVGLQEKV